MKNTLAACCAFLFAAAAYADTKEAAAPAAMDFTKMGPAARKPTNEKAVKKEIDEWFKKGDEIEAKHDMEGMVGRVDFPVYMATDDLKGMPEAKEYTKDAYIAMMKPFYENMPKDSKTTHKPAVTVLSDSLAVVLDEFTMTMGKAKMSGKNSGLLVKKDGTWKWKSMVEAGWGGMDMAQASAAAPATKTAAPAPAAGTTVPAAATKK